MTKRYSVVISVILIVCFPLSSIYSQEIAFTTQGHLNVLVLEGTAYERGLQHGTALKKEIHDLVSLWKKDIQRTYDTDPDVFIKKFLSATNFNRLSKNSASD